MSLAGVRTMEVLSRSASFDALGRTPSLDTLSSLEDIHQQFLADPPMLTIEELRLQLNSCFTCGVSWQDEHVSLDCSECGGYSLQRPCPRCEGQCGSIWKRDLNMSHTCGKARWVGECSLQSSPQPPRLLLQPRPSDLPLSPPTEQSSLPC